MLSWIEMINSLFYGNCIDIDENYYCTRENNKYKIYYKKDNTVINSYNIIPTQILNQEKTYNIYFPQTNNNIKPPRPGHVHIKHLKPKSPTKTAQEALDAISRALGYNGPKDHFKPRTKQSETSQDHIACSCGVDSAGEGGDHSYYCKKREK